MTVQETDARFMEEALELAERGRYTASPNPCVGCLVVADGAVVGRGFHRRTGELHAEPQALAEAGDRTRGATMYVTLEPCAHQGRTAPCVSEIIASGIKRVVSACEDPNPQVAGRGHGTLKEAGIECEVGIGAERSQALNRGFWKRMTAGRPWVCVKQAMSLGWWDGAGRRTQPVDYGSGGARRCAVATGPKRSGAVDSCDRMPG